MATGMLHLHYLFVVVFTLIYLVKTILLLSDKFELLETFRRKTRVLEIIVSFGFLATGVYLVVHLPVMNMFLISKIILIVLSIPFAIIGFKKKNKILASLSFFLIIVSFGLAQKAKNATAGASFTVATGKQIFEEKCTLCHGNDGKLGVNGAKDLSSIQLNHLSIIEIISNGKNGMAAYKEVLTPKQIEEVASYVESDIKNK